MCVLLQAAWSSTQQFATPSACSIGPSILCSCSQQYDHQAAWLQRGVHTVPSAQSCTLIYTRVPHTWPARLALLRPAGSLCIVGLPVTKIEASVMDIVFKWVQGRQGGGCLVPVESLGLS